MRSTLSFTACGLNKWQLVLFSLLDLMQLPEKHQWQEKADEEDTGHLRGEGHEGTFRGVGDEVA